MTIRPYHLPMTLRRLAVISYHSSPLVEPGTGDAGGMTVYVRELGRVLAQRGLCTDIFTRATADLPRIQEICPGVRVVAIEAGPVRPLDKRQIGDYIEEFADG